MERKRGAQQQEELRRPEAKSRVEAERVERERQAMEDPKKMAQRHAIEQRRLENARRLERQGSQPPNSQHEMVRRYPESALLVARRTVETNPRPHCIIAQSA